MATQSIRQLDCCTKMYVGPYPVVYPLSDINVITSLFDNNLRSFLLEGNAIGFAQNVPWQHYFMYIF